MLSCIQVIVAITKGFIYARLRTAQNAYTIAYKSLTRDHSFRLNKDHSKDYFISLRYLKKVVSLLFDQKNLPYVEQVDTGIAVYEGDSKHKPFTTKYIETLQKKPVRLYITQNRMALTKAWFTKVLCLMQVIFLFTLVFPATIFSKKKGIYALILLEYVEVVLLLEHLKRNNIKNVFYFDASEKHANLAALLLAKSGIKVYKVTSEGSLQFHYKYLITDHLCLTSAYQLDEIDFIKSPNHLIGHVVLWPSLKVYDQYPYFNTDAQPVNAPGVIGFISSGVWRRKERNDFKWVEDEYEGEELLMRYLKEFIQTFPSHKLFIYLHPCEKETAELYERARRNYQNDFGNIELLFPDREMPSYALFQRSNLAVSVYSNATFERLYCGYNSLFAPFNFDTFPVKNSMLNNISAKSKQQLFDLISSNINLPSDEFFKKNGIERYHYKNFEYLFKK